MTTVRVTFHVRKDNGSGKTWWALYKPEDIEIVGMGSGRKLASKRESKPTWLPRPQLREKLRKGATDEGEAWVDLPPGSIIRGAAVAAGGYRYAEAKSPFLVVEEGKESVHYAVDGSRYVEICFTNARPLSVEEFEKLQQ